MSEKFIPEQVDPFRFAEQGLGIDGIVRISDMPRLSTNVIANDDIITASLTFGMDEQRTTFLKGHLQTRLTLQCQRCMEPYTYEIIADFVLGVVKSLEEANALPELYEPALTQDGNLALRELIEDEIILNLPIIPRHEPDACNIDLPLKESGWEQGKGENPFHVLESLKHKHR